MSYKITDYKISHLPISFHPLEKKEKKRLREEIKRIYNKEPITKRITESADPLREILTIAKLSPKEFRDIAKQLGIMEVGGGHCDTFPEGLPFSDFENLAIKLRELKKEKNKIPTEVDLGSEKVQIEEFVGNLCQGNYYYGLTLTNGEKIGFKIFNRYEDYNLRNLLMGVYQTNFQSPEFPGFKDLYNFYGGSFFKSESLTSGGWSVDEFIEEGKEYRPEAPSWRRHCAITGTELTDQEGKNKIGKVWIDRDSFSLWRSNPDLTKSYTNDPNINMGFSDWGDYEIDVDTFREFYVDNPDPRVQKEAVHWLRNVARTRKEKKNKNIAFKYLVENPNTRGGAIDAFEEEQIILADYDEAGDLIKSYQDQE